MSWIRMNLSHRSSSVLFRGVRSSTSQFSERGTPQGEVLSPMLLNVLKLVTGILLMDGESIIWYADDICTRTPSYEGMQRILDKLSTRAHDCGSVISAEKTMKEKGSKN